MNEVKKYSTENLDKQKQYLKVMKTSGKTKYYEILVDGKRVVYKTESVEEFDNYRQWVDEDTQSLRLMVYNTKNSHRSKVCEFRTEKFVDGESQHLYATRNRKSSEEEINERVQTKVKELERERELTVLREENNRLKNRLLDAEQYINKIKCELDEHKTKDSGGFEKMLELLLSSYFGKNMQDKGIDENVGRASDTTTSATDEEPMPCNFKKKSSSEFLENASLSNAEKEQLGYLRYALQTLGKENYMKSYEVFDFLLKNPVCIDRVHEEVMNLGKG